MTSTQIIVMFLSVNRVTVGRFYKGFLTIWRFKKGIYRSRKKNTELFTPRDDFLFGIFLPADQNKKRVLTHRPADRNYPCCERFRPLCIDLKMHYKQAIVFVSMLVSI